MSPQEIERQAAERMAAVVPLASIGVEEVGQAAQFVDTWLRSISRDVVTLGRVATVASAVPILGNVMALIDALSDIMALVTEESANEVETFFNWVSLGIDLIGIVPGIGNAARVSLRPTLHLVREAVRNEAQGIGEALLVKLAEHLNATLAGELDTFVDRAIEQLQTLLVEAGAKAQDLTGSLSAALVKLANGQVFEHDPEAPAPRHDSRKDYPNALAAAWGALGAKVLAAEREAERAVKRGGNAYFKELVEWAGAREPLLKNAQRLEALGAQARAKLQTQGQAAVVGSIGFLLAVLKKAIAASLHKRRRGAAVISAQNVAKHERERGQGQLEVLHRQAPAKSDPNPCKTRCGLSAAPRTGTGGSISFATGSETLVHTDFQLPGHMPIVWTRTYHSRLGAYDRAGFGARWITPYTVRIDQADDGSLLYFAPDGRAHRFPRLAEPSEGRPGQIHDDPIEDLTLARGEKGVLILAHRLELIETFEQVTSGRTVSHRLVVQRSRLGHETRLAYRHAGGGLSDIVSGDTHVRTTIDEAGRIESVWQVEGDQAVRPLARYVYERREDGSDDLVQAQDEDVATWRYAYLAATHLLAHYTDRTGRGIALQWMHPDGFSEAIAPANSAAARAYHERADDGRFETTLVWNRHIRLTTVIDAHGGQTRYYFDHLGYPYRIVHPAVAAEDGRTFALEEWFTHDAHQNVTTHLHPDGSEDRYVYDERGNLTRHTRADGSTVHYAHDAQENVTGFLDAEGQAWKRRYDGALLVEETDPLGHETRYEYDPNGQPIEIIDARGGRTQLQYAPSGELIAYTDCSGQTSRWAHDDRGRLVSATNSAGETTRYAYEAGQLARILHPDGSEEHFVRDAEGRLLVHRDALLRETRYRYDEAGQLSERIDANRHSLGYRWDRLGRLEELRNENARSHRIAYDARGRILCEVHFDDARTDYSYIPETGVLQQVIEADTLTQLTYDPLGRLTERSAWAYERTTRKYEPASRETERYGYDGSGRLVEASNPSIRLQWFYDPVGNIRAEHQHMSFDAQGVPSQNVTTAVWAHCHDELGNRIQTVRPDGHATTWLIYGSGHVHGLMLDEAEVLRFERDKLHREVLRTQSNRIAEARRYDRVGRLAEQRLQRAAPLGDPDAEPTRSGASAAGLRRDYRYDRAGELTEIQDTRRGMLNYHYDPVGRLLKAYTSLGSETFAFDPAGNLVDSNATGTAATPRINGIPMLLDNLVRDYAGTHNDYDRRGNVVRRTHNGETTHLRWDTLGRLREARTGARRTTFLYDPLGRRLVKRNEAILHDHGRGGDRWYETELRRLNQNLRAEGIGTTVYGWDGDQMVWERSDVDRRTLHYVYEPEGFVPLLQASTPADITEAFLRRPANIVEAYMNLAGDYDMDLDPLYNGMYEPGIDAKGDTPPPLERLHFYQCDQIGTPMELTDAEGSIAWEASYQAWGRAKVTITNAARAAGTTNPMRFQGQHLDEETGLHYNRFRYYDPAIGHFLSKDPIGFGGGINLGLYAPNPTGWIDPFGLIGNRANRKAGEILDRNEVAAGGHAFCRHGAHTTNQQQDYRARTGVPPDQPNKKPKKSGPDSTRYLSNVDQLDAHQRGLEMMKKTGLKGATIDMGRPIGEGFKKGGGGCPISTNKATIIRNSNNKIVTSYPNLI